MSPRVPSPEGDRCEIIPIFPPCSHVCLCLSPAKPKSHCQLLDSAFWKTRWSLRRFFALGQHAPSPRSGRSSRARLPSPGCSGCLQGRVPARSQPGHLAGRPARACAPRGVGFAGAPRGAVRGQGRFRLISWDRGVLVFGAAFWQPPAAASPPGTPAPRPPSAARPGGGNGWGGAGAWRGRSGPVRAGTPDPEP